MQGYVVAGIGTEIGKTVVSAILCHALQAAYWKPVQAGELDFSDSHKVQKWAALSEAQLYQEAYALNQPMSPHAAAPLDGLTIDINQFSLPQSQHPLIVELAGGIMVPLNEEKLNLDLLKRWQLPVILVSRYYLGNINHSLLTAAILQQHGVPVKGWIFNGEPVQPTKEAILNFSKLPLLAEIPEAAQIDFHFVQKQAKRLQRRLRQALL
ncbi:MAG: dethiobiotin synthase [Bacteroidota bacterium]